MARIHQRGQVLILLVGFLFLGGSSVVASIYGFQDGRSSGEVEKQIKKHVADKERAKQARTAFDAWVDEMKSSDRRLDKHLDELLDLAERYGTKRADFDPVLSRIDADQDRIVQNTLTLRDQLRQHITAEEWAQVFQLPPKRPGD